MARCVCPVKFAIQGDLNRICHDTYADELALVKITDPVSGPGEADVSRRIDQSHDLTSLGGAVRHLGSTIHPFIVFGSVTPRVRGDQHAVVGDVEMSVPRLDAHSLTRHVAPNVVAMLQDADPSQWIHPPPNHHRLGFGFADDLDLAVDDFVSDVAGKLEAMYRCCIS